MFSKTFAVALSFACGAAGIVFHGPTATPIAEKIDANGFTPRPTSSPRPALELFRRQEDDPSFCGYLEGDRNDPVSCSIGNCMYDEVFQWFGCCLGSYVEDCFVQTGCVESASISACLKQSSCRNDLYLTICTEEIAPYCAFLYTQISGKSYGHFECAGTQTTFEVFSTSASDNDISSSLPTDISFSLEPPTTRSSSRANSTSTDSSTGTAGESSTGSADSSSLSSAPPATTGVTSTQDPFNQGPTAPTGAAGKAADVALAAGIAGVVAIFV